MASKYPRGSEWRKWDLHIHTPFTKLNNQFGDDWSSYANALIESEISVIGSTNYFCFSENEIEETRRLLTENGYEGIILPNLEFRISQENRQNEFINIHILFSEKISTAEISRAFERLELINTDDGGRRIYCSDSEIQRAGLGYDQILVEYGKLIECLEGHFCVGKDLLLIGCPRGYGSFRPQNGDGRGIQFAIEIDKKINALLGNNEDREFFLDKNRERYEGSKKKPVYYSSDAHENKDIGNKFTWIKADPTFDGLLQTLYESEERVKIQDQNPDEDFKKPYFSSISVSGAAMKDGLPVFSDDVLPLNNGMVTLIGGRGTGKSVLLDCVYKLFNSSEIITEPRLIKVQPSSLKIVYTKSDAGEIEYKFGEEANLDYLHVRQGDIKNIANDPQKLSGHIKDLLGINTSKEQSEYDYEISSIINRIEKSLAWFELEDSEGNKTNDKTRNEKIIQSSRNLVNTITTDTNKENIEKYQKNSQEINSRNTAINRFAELKSKLAAFKVESKRDIEDINNLQLDGNVVPFIDFSTTESAIQEITNELDNKIKEFKENNVTIENQFREQGIDQDVGGLLKKLGQYQRNIDLAEERILEYDAKLVDIKTDIEERTRLVEKIEGDLEAQLETIKSSFEEVSLGKESWSAEQKELVNKLLRDINIDGNIEFDVNAFYKGLVPLLNGQKFRSTNSETQEDRIKARFNVKSYETYLRLIKNEKVIDDGEREAISLNEFAIQKEYFLKNNYDIYEYLYLHRYRQTYLSVKPLIEYLGKQPEKLSVGQRGTFYVCMKLATDPFGSPFVFDQPEDDLDNKFIMRELVPLFREIKKYRQVIIATHNANLVVNADAEQVIIASNDEEILSYMTGSIENTSLEEPRGIRENLCDILEGGQTAFETREKKYGFEH